MEPTHTKYTLSASAYIQIDKNYKNRYVLTFKESIYMVSWAERQNHGAFEGKMIFDTFGEAQQKAEEIQRAYDEIVNYSASPLRKKQLEEDLKEINQRTKEGKDERRDELINWFE